jgi:hypothetical protein
MPRNSQATARNGQATRKQRPKQGPHIAARTKRFEAQCTFSQVSGRFASVPRPRTSLTKPSELCRKSHSTSLGTRHWQARPKCWTQNYVNVDVTTVAWVCSLRRHRRQRLTPRHTTTHTTEEAVESDTHVIEGVCMNIEPTMNTETEPESPSHIGRRSFLLGAAAIGLLASSPAAVLAATKAKAKPKTPAKITGTIALQSNNADDKSKKGMEALVAAFNAKKTGTVQLNTVRANCTERNSLSTSPLPSLQKCSPGWPGRPRRTTPTRGFCSTSPMFGPHRKWRGIPQP